MKTKLTRSFNVRSILLGFSVAFAGSLPLQAATVDLTTLNSSGSANGAFFKWIPSQSTGSGVIDPFVRISDNATLVEGYNADARPVMPQVNTSGTFTKDIQFSAIPQVVNPAGAAAGTYLEFLLDINQTKESPLLSLHEIEIYTRTGKLAVANTYASLTGNAAKKWDLDVGGDGNSVVELNYALNTGSGSGDMLAYIPLTFFGGVLPTDYLYLYSAFGNPNGNNDGFEEWAVRTGPTVAAPDSGSTLVLLGAALMVLAGVARRGFVIA
jgi:hypothetical protein